MITDDEFDDLKAFDPGPVPDGLELDPDPQPLKTVVITIREMPGQRLNMESSPTFQELCAVIKSGEPLVGADALAYHTLAYVIQKISPAKSSREEIFIPTPKLLT